MGNPSSSVDPTSRYVTTGRVDLNLSMPDRDSFILIADEAIGQLKKVFSSEVGLGTIGQTLNVYQETLSDEVLSIRAEPLITAKKDSDLHELFFAADGTLHELLVDVYYHHRTQNSTCYPVTYLGVVEPVRFFDLYALGYHDRRLGLPATDFLNAVEDFLRKKDEKVKAKWELVSESRQAVIGMQERLEKIRIEELRTSRHS